MSPDDVSKQLKAGEKAKETGRQKAKRCPVCGKPALAVSKPFCSERCRDVDLGRWLSGSYVIAAGEDDDEADSAPQDINSEHR